MTGKRPKDTEQAHLGFAYLVWNPRSGFYKLGSARRPLVRLAQLSREMCTKCVLVHTIATNNALRLEREIQKRFLDNHIGGEWFELSEAELAAIQSVSTVWYKGESWVPRERGREWFDTGAKKLPICGQTSEVA